MEMASLEPISERTCTDRMRPVQQDIREIKGQIEGLHRKVNGKFDRLETRVFQLVLAVAGSAVMTVIGIIINLALKS